MRGMKYIVSVLFLNSAMAATALAADLGGGPPPMAPGNDQQMEFGNSWYLRGDIGAVLETNPKISNDLNLVSDSARRASYSADLGFGYKFSNWLRADIIAEQRSTASRSGIGGTAVCPTGVVLNPGGLTTSLVNSNCDIHGASKLSHWNLMANVYADLGTWGGLTPYVGAGLGLSHSVVSGNTWATVNGTGAAYNSTLIDPLTLVTTNYYNYSQAKSAAKSQLAWNVMAGFGYALNEHATIDLGYRYLNMGRYTGLPDKNGAVLTRKLTSQEIRLGVRYMID